MIYSNDEKVHDIMRQCIPYLCGTYVIGSMGWCGINVLEAMSKNKYKSYICVASAWFGYVPLSVFFMNKSYLLNVKPVTCIFIVGLLVETIRASALWITVFRVNWKKCCIEAQERNEQYQRLVDDGNDKDMDENGSVQGEKNLQPASLDVNNDAATA